MVCKKCGNFIGDDAKFCPYCGSSQSIFVDLVQRAMEGDGGAASELYSRTIEKVYFAVKVLIKDEDTANDIVQDSYIKGFKYLHQLKDADSYQAWMKRIAHNKAVDWLRSQRVTYVEEFTSTDEAEVQERMEERVEYLPEDFADRRETARLLNEILDSLPEEQRVVLCMYYYDQMSSREIAEELGIGMNTVKSRLIYARKKVEIQVRELERKGTKLYSLAPIPFFIALIHAAEKTATEIPGAAVFQAVRAGAAEVLASGGAAAGVGEMLSESGREVTGQTTSKVAEEAARTGAKKVAKESVKATARSVGKEAASGAIKAGAGVAAKGGALKGIAVALAVTMAGGGAAVGVKVGGQYFEKKQEEKMLEEQRLLALSVTPTPTPEPTPIPEPTPTPEPTAEEMAAAAKERDLREYSGLINTYFTAIEINWNGLIGNYNSFDGEMLPFELPAIENMGYTLKDFDKDGRNELVIVGTGLSIAEINNPFVYDSAYPIVGVYTIKNDQVKGIAVQPSELGPRYMCEDGKILWFGRGGYDHYSYNYFSVGDALLENSPNWMQLLPAGSVFNDYDEPQRWFYSEEMNGIGENKTEITMEEAREFVNRNKLLVMNYAPFSELEKYRN